MNEPSKKDITILTRDATSIEALIERRKLVMRSNFMQGLVKRSTFSVYRFGDTDTYLFCRGTLSDTLKANMGVSVYREDIMPYYPPELVREA